MWDKTFGGSADDNLYDLVITPDGGYLLGGTSTSGIGGDKTEANRGKEELLGHKARCTRYKAMG